ncbi:hypothetical protein Halha_0846 [Halobacteroides halobius DSM 5150]|uniref:Membrane fusion protein n=1 Tax=Halobacteroides halobius (strain ATCC 35273 / DSM 5150 / MD-1) TaxID=748449 RepID=L0K905_HALHC|nr:HlyD family efflux transporter periplasmic adaptor subunit [Halobacteroides halobius]AGB40814.1 hypothetical protein Halha_0846 [Halobacteroides halobius DSM 5150]
MRDFGQISYPKQEKVNHKRKRGIVVWSIFFLICASLTSLVAINLLGYHSSKVVTARYQMLRKEFKTNGLLIKDEEVTFASQSGRLELNVPEGTRLSAGNKILTIYNGQQKDELYNYKAGIVSYKIDGLETTLTIKSRDELTYKSFKELRSSISKVAENDIVNIGRPLFKIIDNFKIYLAVLLPQNKLISYETGDKVEIEFNNFEVRNFQGEIDMILPDKPQNVMIIKLDKFIPLFVKLRRAEVTVIKEKYYGLVLPKSALIRNKNQQLGVQVQGYVKNYFQEVEVKARIDNKVVVKGVLPGDKVLLN